MNNKPQLIKTWEELAALPPSETHRIEQEAFDGLNESYIEMDKELQSIAPKCHLMPMQFMQGDGENCSNTWWECSYCGHTKDLD